MKNKSKSKSKSNKLEPRIDTNTVNNMRIKPVILIYIFIINALLMLANYFIVYQVRTISILIIRVSRIMFWSINIGILSIYAVLFLFYLIKFTIIVIVKVLRKLIPKFDEKIKD